VNDTYAVNPGVPAKNIMMLYQHPKGRNLPHPWLPPMVMSLKAVANTREYIFEEAI
jgi:hypothetical protein